MKGWTIFSHQLKIVCNGAVVVLGIAGTDPRLSSAIEAQSAKFDAKQSNRRSSVTKNKQKKEIKKMKKPKTKLIQTIRICN